MQQFREQADIMDPLYWIHGIPDVGPEDLSPAAGGTINWFPRQTLAQQGTFTGMFIAAV